MLVSIIRNLTSNAVKFSPSSGHVNINCHVTDDEIHFDIEDNGIGIPDDLILGLF